MTSWDAVLRHRERAKRAHEAYRAAVKDAQAAARLTQDERDAASMRGAFHVAYAGEAAGSDHLRKLRDAAAAEIATAIADAEQAQRDLAAWAESRFAKAKPSGIEGVAARIETSDARSRVRRLLDDGVALPDVIARAVEIGDRAALDALRSEVKWMTAGAGSLDAAIARQLGTGTDDALAAVQGALRRIDRAELGLVAGDEHEAIESRLRIAEEWPGIRLELAQYADRLDTGRTLADAIEVRMAQGATPPNEGAAA